MNKRLNEKYLTQMNALKHNDDVEHVHCIADHILCELLTELGYTELVSVFDDLEKWYS